MTQAIAFYMERAEDAAKEARDATLNNVRDRALRSEAAWRAMADQARQVKENKARNDQAREASAAAVARFPSPTG
ncbi:MAG: hypothetical protein PHE36_01770 [Novosphingobium sp.]|nr:hypothetical protein [Novosphingobium sp.]